MTKQINHSGDEPLKVTKVSDRCWGVVEEGKTYPGHIFSTMKEAKAFAEGRCVLCQQKLNHEDSK